MCVFSLICVPLGLALSVLLEADAHSLVWGMEKMLLLQIVYFAIGVFSFPPHSFIGLMSRELVCLSFSPTFLCNL